MGLCITESWESLTAHDKADRDEFYAVYSADIDPYEWYDLITLEEAKEIVGGEKDD